MPDKTNPTEKRQRWIQRLKQLVVPVIILLMAGGIVMLIAGNWNTWTSEQVEQKTDDANVRADLTPLSTKVAGLVARVAVADYQTVKAGDLLVQLQDADFRAQVEQAAAAVAAGEAALINNRRQKELQDSRIVQAGDGIRAADADIAAAEAGIVAANSSIANARSGIEATKADVQRTLLERRRQEALIASESATRQKLEQVVADEERYRATTGKSRGGFVCNGGPTGQPAGRPCAGACAASQQQVRTGSAKTPTRRAGFAGTAAPRRFEREEGFADAVANKSGLHANRRP